MQRHKQTKQELIPKLGEVLTDWKDEFAQKAYGATGSKQSDVIGDVRKIIFEKRSDTYFFLVTDGVTWKARMRDFERLIEHQNLGDIYRIYTQQMTEELLSDLKQIKHELGI